MSERKKPPDIPKQSEQSKQSERFLFLHKSNQSAKSNGSISPSTGLVCSGLVWSGLPVDILRYQMPNNGQINHIQSFVQINRNVFGWRQSEATCAGQGRNNNRARSGCLSNLDIMPRLVPGLSPTASKTASELGSSSRPDCCFWPGALSPVRG